MLKSLHRCDEALSVFRAVLHDAELAYGAESMESAVATFNAGYVLILMGNGAEGEAYVQSSLNMLERLGRENTPQFASCLCVKAQLLATQGEAELALACLERCLVIQRQTLPLDHPSLASTLTCISQMQSRLCRPAGDAAAAAAAIYRRTQTVCSGPKCQLSMRPDDKPLDVCVNCRCTFYCGKACQTADWKSVHKAECKALIAKAAAAKR